MQLAVATFGMVDGGTLACCATTVCKKSQKGKSEHLYSALHGIQTTLKRSGMDHTAFNLQRTTCQPLPRKRSPDGASIECTGGHLIAAHYSFIDPERMKG